MFGSKTLFVIGAGASCEVDLPSGKKLTKIIASDLKADFDSHRGYLEPRNKEIGEALRWKVNEASTINTEFFSPHDKLQKYLEAAHIISEAMPLEPSIDQFIDNHRGNKYIEFCGKLAIVNSILVEERKSKIFVDYNKSEYFPHYDRIESTWFSQFIELLCLGCPLDKLDNLFDNIAMVIFNYDRCVEHFLYHGIQTKYGIEARRAAEVMKNLVVIHPYGTVGKLEWEEEGAQISYGHQITSNGLLSLTNEIKTFAERIDDSTSVQSMKKLANEAEKIVFLGFGFHKQNIELLVPPGKQNSKQLFLSSFGLSHSIGELVSRDVQSKFAHGLGELHMKPEQSCFEVFTEYGRLIAE